MTTVYDLKFHVPEARGSAVSRLQGASGTATALVSETGSVFGSGLPDADVSILLSGVRADRVLPPELEGMLASPVSGKFNGMILSSKEKTRHAEISSEIVFTGSGEPGQPPESVKGWVQATGRGLAGLVFKSARLEFEGTLKQS